MTMSDRPPGQAVHQLRAALAERVVVADGAMGTMLQASPATLDDFDGHEGCNEILNVTRPDVVRGPSTRPTSRPGRTASPPTRSAPTSATSVNTGSPSRIEELSEAGARIARAAADAGQHRAAPAGCSARWAPAPSCRPSATSAFRRPARRLPAQRDRPAARRRGRDRGRDLPGPAAGEGGDHRRAAGDGRRTPRRPADRPRHHRDDRHDAARQRDRRGAHRAGAARHRPDRAELRHRARRR